MKTKKISLTILLIAVFALSCVGFVGLFQSNTAYAENKTVDIYAINDFHGMVDQMPQIAGFLAARKKEDAVIINSGDMFQGSMESNSNYGKLLAECMDITGFDSFTYGNHEFDWGLDNLKTLAANSKVPYLGANIYEWNATTRQWGEFASDLAKPYTVVEANGLKVGIIGVIGKDQITSISSQLVQTIGFKDPLPIIKELATELREGEEQCDVVVVSAHAGPQGIVGENDNYGSPSSAHGLENYVDAVFCAHTHSKQEYIVDGIPFIQGKRYGEYVSHVKLFVDGNGNVSCSLNENVSYSSLPSRGSMDQTVANQVQGKINNSNAQIAGEASKQLAILNGSLDSSTAVPRLVCNAIADYALSQGYKIELALVNNARNNLIKGTVTYTELYEAIPFDNVVYVAEVSGRDIISMANRNDFSIWRVTGNRIMNTSQRYTIAVIDYVLYHQNSNRQYNYFPSAFTSGATAPVALTKQGVDVYNYRLITRDFLLKQGTIDASLYSGSNLHTDATLLTREVDIVTPSNDGFPIYLAVLGSEAVIIVALVIALIVVSTKRAKSKRAN
ncbi:MAG: bifunctional metallophosphatase/5'-nucleotidase [Clostridiales bacterium]|nr:bifunctional metallophosphatase/5'-nucleotidase [Clostridiales bacterium]